MGAEYRRLTDHPGVQAARQIDKLGDIVGRDLLLKSAVSFTGKYGQGYRLQLADLDTGEFFQVLTTGVVICSVIDTIDLENDLPMMVRFVKRDRYYDIE